MPARAIASATISFGLVSIPVKLYTATSSEQVRFNMLHPETKSRVKQQYIDASTGEVVDRNVLVKGYEYGRDQYVVFTEEELKALERALEIDNAFALARVRRAEAYAETELTDRAREELVQAMALLPDRSTLSNAESMYVDGSPQR